MTEEETSKIYQEALELYNKEEFEKAIEAWKNIPKEFKVFYKTQFNIGLAFSKLKRYNKMIEYWANIPPNESNYTYAQWVTGLYYISEEKDKNKASQALINCQKDIFELFEALQLKDINSVKQVLSDVLDHKENDFFNTTITNDTDNKEIYKKIFIQSLHIISLLFVDLEQENQVAHYTRKSTAENLLFANSPIRLGSIHNTNDPKEGISLLDFLNINFSSKEQPDYQTFTSCFTFNPDSLNQFRLYGKENNLEATGVSIIVDRNLFNNSMNINLSYLKNKVESLPQETHKYSLYRCIYLDPETQEIISVGHKEEYSLYREYKASEEKNKSRTLTRRYKEKIEDIIKSIRKEMDILRKLINDNKKQLDQDILAELLLPLRHLTKHVAFKEEQECRIFDIELVSSEKVQPKDATSFDQMYIPYDDLSKYTQRVIAAPATDNFEKFQNSATDKGYHFICEKSNLPFSIKR